MPDAAWRLPLWWPAVNAAMPILAGTLIFLLRPYLQGWRVLAVILLIPAADGMANAAVAWPTWNALNTRLPAAAVWAAGCVTVALASLMIYFIAQVADTKSAGRFSGRQTTEDVVSGPQNPEVLSPAGR